MVWLNVTVLNAAVERWHVSHWFVLLGTVWKTVFGRPVAVVPL